MSLVDDYPKIKYFAITVKKENVQEHIRKDSNKLYNYMTRLLLLDELCGYDSVRIAPDPRSIKVASGNSMHDYLVQLYGLRNVLPQKYLPNQKIVKTTVIFNLLICSRGLCNHILKMESQSLGKSFLVL